ncbi:MAG: hypothetical protein JRN58_08760 [Nitrososphaerota archaeon]|nr:hypothetical protein [Nitrososphaerota archaeon]MDG6979155.1 hypothetical protein [Nitrososphaerota archaeon]
MAQALGLEGRFAVAGRRSPFEVRMDVLRAVADGSAKPTRIMYRSNTSWVVLQRNLSTLLAAGFVRQGGTDLRAEYTATATGMNVVSDYLALLERAASELPEVRP